MGADSPPASIVAYDPYGITVLDRTVPSLHDLDCLECLPEGEEQSMRQTHLVLSCNRAVDAMDDCRMIARTSADLC